MPQGLKDEIGKRRPFDSPEQEAYLNLLRTESILSADFESLFKLHGLSEATYNALRILRGATLGEQAAGKRSCHEIGEQLVARVPDVTRLIDRLESQGLAARERCGTDRRVVHVSITRKGLDLLARLDQPTLRLHESQMGHMTRGELGELNRLLVRARSARVNTTADSPVQP